MAPYNVLIVDDAPQLRERLKARLEKIPGVRVSGEAATVPEGIQAFRTLNPDAIVLDIQMPGGTGIDVLETVKQENPRTVVIMLTNYPLPQLRKKSMEAGAEFFFDKCCEVERVIGVLQDLSAQHSIAQEK